MLESPPPYITGIFDAIDPAVPIADRAAGVDRALADNPRAAIELLCGLVAQAYGANGINQIRAGSGVLRTNNAPNPLPYCADHAHACPGPSGHRPLKGESR